MPIDSGDPVPLYRLRLRLGRSTTCDIAFQYPDVPDILCDLEWIDGFWWIRELTQAPKPPPPRPLLPGDVIDVGGQMYAIEYRPERKTL